MRYSNLYETRNAVTPQTEPLPGREADQVQNSAGGYVFQSDAWQRLTRFLILGSDGGTYYVSPRQLTKENAEVVLRCLSADAKRTIAEIVDVSDKGRAYRNDAAIFALALCAGLGEPEASKLAYAALPQVARTGTHLFQFNEALSGFRGWSRARRTAVARWYNDMQPDRLAYQAIKYQQRGGWSHRDLLRLAHVKPTDSAHDALYGYIAKGQVAESLRLVNVYEQVKAATNEAEVIRLIRDEALTWEFVPGQWLGSAAVWESLLPQLPMTALLRNLARMTANGLLKPLGSHLNTVVERLTNQDALRKARVHPLAVLVAMKIYAQGKGDKGSLTWTPVQQVAAALEDAYYLSFGNVAPSGKRLLLALDVSGSMTNAVAGGTPLSCAEASGAMAMVTVRTEANYHVMAFNDGLQPLAVTEKSSLADVLRRVSGVNFGGTDCSLPMRWAKGVGVDVDAFIILTDNETWAGGIHPTQALQQYRQARGIDAKLVVVGMASNGFTIADPQDAGSLDVVGFDTATPQLISDFAKGL